MPKQRFRQTGRFQKSRPVAPTADRIAPRDDGAVEAEDVDIDRQPAYHGESRAAVSDSERVGHFFIDFG